MSKDKRTRMEVYHRLRNKLYDILACVRLLCGGRWAGCNRRIERVLLYLKNPPSQIREQDKEIKQAEAHLEELLKDFLRDAKN